MFVGAIAGLIWKKVDAKTADPYMIPMASGFIAGEAAERGVGVGGVADTPVVREWDDLDDRSLPDALNDFAWDLGGSDDIHATARYRREMVRRLGKNTIEEARRCAC